MDDEERCAQAPVWSPRTERWAVLWEGDAAPDATTAASEDPPRNLAFSEEMALEVDDVERLGLLSRGEPGGTARRRGMTLVDAGSVSPADLSLSEVGRRLYHLMGLHDVEVNGRRAVVASFSRVGPADNSGE